MRREERDQVEQLVGGAHEPLQPRLRQPQLGAHLGRLARGQLRQLRLDPGADRDAAGALPPRVLDQLRRRLAISLVDVGDVEHRLGAQRLKVRRRVRRQGRGRHAARRLPTAEGLDHPLQPVAFGRGLLAPRIQPPCGPAPDAAAPGRDRRAAARRPPPRRRRAGRRARRDEGPARHRGCGRRGRSRRSRGSRRGSGFPAPLPPRRRAPGRRCRGTRSSPGPAGLRRPPAPPPPGARRAPRRWRRWARPS